MIIKNMWLWHKNSDWSDEDFTMFSIVVISIICAFIVSIGTYWGLSIFGPWYQGSSQVWYFTCASFVAQQFYFWSRYVRYSMLYRQHRLDKRSGVIDRKKWFKFKSRSQKREEALSLKLQERNIALGFANSLKK